MRQLSYYVTYLTSIKLVICVARQYVRHLPKTGAIQYRSSLVVKHGLGGGFEPTTSAMLKFYLDTGKPMTHHDDAVKVAPDSYKVLLENDQVRVLEVRIKQGAKTEMHSHPRSVAICLNDQRLKFTFPNGKSEDTNLKRGQAVWLDGISHAVENTGTEDVSSVVVELKK